MTLSDDDQRLYSLPKTDVQRNHSFTPEPIWIPGGPASQAATTLTATKR